MHLLAGITDKVAKKKRGFNFFSDTNFCPFLIVELGRSIVVQLCVLLNKNNLAIAPINLKALYSMG